MFMTPMLMKIANLDIRYHYLNHYALFGGGYRSSAMSIMKKLLSKYT
jgi:fructosamine-3-kinase